MTPSSERVERDHSTFGAQMPPVGALFREVVLGRGRRLELAIDEVTAELVLATASADGDKQVLRLPAAVIVPLKYALEQLGLVAALRQLAGGEPDKTGHFAAENLIEPEISTLAVAP